MNRRGLFYLLLALCAFLLPSCSATDEEVTVQGAGATFPAPLYKRWFLEYYKVHPDVRVNYQAIGSGAGIRQFTEGLTAFGASDAAMSNQEVELFRTQRGGDVQLVPLTAGSIVICYHVPDLGGALKLTRSAYLQIFLGEITKWDDPALKACNPGLKLPKLDITVVRRADGSGTTYAFTNHLEAVGKNIGVPWTPGVGKSIVWPRKEMLGGRGNAGVTALIQQTPGAIGYLESGYADLAIPKLPTALLENRAGSFVGATVESCQAALANARIPDDFRIWVPDPEGKDSYPIVTYTWLLCYKDYTKYRGNPHVGAALKKVIEFCLTDGQAFATKLGYTPLPKKVVDRVLPAVAAIKIGTEK
jgi:phosphate transport system substrate-binding protein